MYEQNAVTLDAVCAERSVIRHVSKHRNPDGTMDIAGNLKIWNDALSRFDQMLFVGRRRSRLRRPGPAAAPALSRFCT